MEEYYLRLRQKKEHYILLPLELDSENVEHYTVKTLKVSQGT